MPKETKPAEFLIEKCTNGVLIKLKNLTEMYSERFEVSLNDKISNPLIQTLESLSALYQLLTGKFSF